MKKIFIGSLAFLALGLFIYSCKSSSTNDKSNTKRVHINFESKSGSKVTGDATFVEKNGEVSLVAKLSGLNPGVHAIHIHEKADCSSADAASAGGHWNPTFKKHGKWTDAEHHKGDIGNFTANVDGEATVIFKTDEWCIGCGDATKDILGKGLIVHDKPDDFVTQPSGNAGARVACSAIIQ
ncbi:MAG TPA: superoxide dismutase family protein [Flavobacterium sp.]|uniref:superoxide dismutase family protein n=1 Tax=Flavobacterium sp. TaxID=239 RepID=UPI002CBF8437|nr:superoxide dismutase family protein [Flavobacterium sp.]HNP33486.1 superoxide dismutase family protein [Flavobacterium sp.]